VGNSWWGGVLHLGDSLGQLMGQLMGATHGAIKKIFEVEGWRVEGSF